MSYVVEEERLEAFVMKRLDCFRNIEFVYGGFSNWGTKEAVETQAITLLECECLVRAPKKIEKDPRIVMVIWRELASNWYRTGSATLHNTEIKTQSFSEAVYRICMEIRRRLYEAE